MNNINNIFSKNEIDNKLKDFKEGQDYSVVREGKKLVYDFHSDWLRDEFGKNYTTVYEVAENWDSDNFNYHQEAGEYVNNDKGTRITYHYKHKINKNGGFHINWGKSWGDSEVLTMNAKPAEPRKIGFLENEEVANHRRNLKEFEEKRRLLKNKIEGLSTHIATEHSIEDKKGREQDLRELEHDLAETESKIRYHEDWLAKNNNFDSKPAGCFNCGFKDIGSLDKHCQKCGVFLCDKAKEAKSDLQKENQELRQQLTAVQKQLAEVLEELKKLKGNVNGRDGEKLEQQIVQNEKLMQDSKNVSVAELRDQINKSETLMKEFNNVSTNKDDKGNGSLPYVIGGSIILASAGIIGYFLLKKNKQK